MPVHLYGRCADMQAIVAFAREHKLLVVEDAAQAHGARRDGRRVGTFGDAAAFSFYPTKNLGAIGDGGAVVTSDRQVAERVRRLRNYGVRERQRRSAAGTAASIRSRRRCCARSCRFSTRGTRAAARSPSGTARRSGLPVQLPARPRPRSTCTTSTWCARAARVAARPAGPAGRGHARPLPTDRSIATPPTGPSPAPVTCETSERLCAEVLSLPLYPELRDEEVEFVIDAVHASFPRLRVAR